MQHPKVVTAVITVGVVVVVAVLCGLTFVYSGLYDVTAARPKSALTDWVLSTTMQESVHRNARQVTVPADLERRSLSLGIDHYREMCVTCHGAPGIDRSDIGQGLNPQPPLLQKAVSQWKPAELYWIIRNGVKMTGMPAFGPTHTENQLWAITALVRRLPAMTPAEYQSLASARVAPTTGAAEHEHEHEHDDQGSG